MSDKKDYEFGLWEDYKKKGNKAAKKELISSLTPLIRSQANKYKNSGLPYPALELEGRKLTARALDTYDPDQGAQLNTWVTTNLQKLSRFTNQYQNIGSIPEPRALLIGKYNTLYANLEDDLGREPTISELADAMKVSESEIERLQNELRSDLHMELPSPEEDAGGFYIYVRPETKDPQLQQAFDFVYHDSEGTDKKILEYTFGYGGSPQLTARDIKKKLKLTESQLRRRKENLAKSMKELM